MLRDELKKRKITQTDLAEEFGVTQAAVSKWLTKRVPATRVTKLSELTGIPPQELRPDVFGQ